MRAWIGILFSGESRTRLRILNGCRFPMKKIVLRWYIILRQVPFKNNFQIRRTGRLSISPSDFQIRSFDFAFRITSSIFCQNCTSRHKHWAWEWTRQKKRKTDQWFASRQRKEKSKLLGQIGGSESDKRKRLLKWVAGSADALDRLCNGVIMPSLVILLL